MVPMLAAESASFPVLTALVVLPVIGALFLLVLPNNRPEHFKQVAFIFSGSGRRDGDMGPHRFPHR